MYHIRFACVLFLLFACGCNSGQSQGVTCPELIGVWRLDAEESKQHELNKDLSAESLRELIWLHAIQRQEVIEFDENGNYVYSSFGGKNKVSGKYSVASRSGDTVLVRIYYPQHRDASYTLKIKVVSEGRILKFIESTPGFWGVYAPAHSL